MEAEKYKQERDEGRERQKPRTTETMRDGASRETEMERGDDRGMGSETEIRVGDGVEERRLVWVVGGRGGPAADAQATLRAALTRGSAAVPGSVGSTWWRRRTCCRSMDCWRGTSPRVSGWRPSTFAALRFSQLQGEPGAEDCGGDFQGLC